MAIRFRRYTQRQLWFYAKRAFWILISWTAISNVVFFYEYYTLLANNALTSEYDFQQSFTANLIVGVLAGLIGGVLTVNLMERWLRKHSFLRALLQIVIAYTLTAIVVSFFGGLYYFSEELGVGMFNHEVVELMIPFFGEFIFIKNFLLWLVIVIVTLIILMVNEKYGPGVFPDFLMGRYFKPKRERRIFMFCDIKNATGIAEILDEEAYFNFLKDFFRDIAPAIVQTRGEVYQYVGDEIVVSWKMKHGLKRGNAIQCFYSMKKIIRYKRPRYRKKYGLFPEFKVGYHYGDVMVGEIGQIKREIVFSGDVLNTASRIQSLCNEMGVEILASKEFADININLPLRVKREDLGEEKLRGKADEMKLVTYTRKGVKKKMI
ncbi:MAG: adenylate/guanylate cyclase domain-containing protein [Patiriisocius sp.]|uniref:adenylate/guanylate cyclase domain-containing protein n=1 Tax=Patiriisocius sp. TaxID=2822396 RepID=UPI003EF7484E